MAATQMKESAWQNTKAKVDPNISTDQLLLLHKTGRADLLIQEEDDPEFAVAAGLDNDKLPFKKVKQSRADTVYRSNGTAVPGQKPLVQLIDPMDTLKNFGHKTISSIQGFKKTAKSEMNNPVLPSDMRVVVAALARIAEAFTIHTKNSYPILSALAQPQAPSKEELTLRVWQANILGRTNWIINEELKRIKKSVTLSPASSRDPFSKKHTTSRFHEEYTQPMNTFPLQSRGWVPEDDYKLQFSKESEVRLASYNMLTSCKLVTRCIEKQNAKPSRSFIEKLCRRADYFPRKQVKKTNSKQPSRGSDFRSRDRNPYRSLVPSYNSHTRNDRFDNTRNSSSQASNPRKRGRDRTQRPKAPFKKKRKTVA